MRTSVCSNRDHEKEKMSGIWHTFDDQKLEHVGTARGRGVGSKTILLSDLIVRETV